MAHAFDIKPLDATFGAVVNGVRLAALDEGTWGDLYAAWLEHALLIFPGQQLTRDLDAAESERFLQELVDFACQPPRVYFHDWAPGDSVVWDNRCLLHRATPWNMTEPRVMWHSRIAGDPGSEAALA